VKLVLVGARTTPENMATARPVFEGLVGADGAADRDAHALAAQGCDGRIGEAAVISEANGAISFVVGLGATGELDGEAFRRAGAALARAAAHVDAVAFDLNGASKGTLSDADALGAFGEGAILGAYRFDGRKRAADKSEKLDKLVLVAANERSTSQAIARATSRGAAVSLARDLVNTPSADKTPTRFAEIAAEVGTENGLRATVFGEDEIRAMGLGGLLAVARGSAEAPRLVRLEYAPGDSDVTVALVGKGITFDSGGLSLKTMTQMFTMKEDCGGAAAVLAAMCACRAHGVPVKVLGFLPLSENMPGGSAQKPGDVFTARNGKTVEVLNTDAEGRLVLADALSLAAEERPDAIVDIATLTGPIIVALGRRLAGLMGNDSRLVSALEHAASAAAEPLWHLPLPAAYRALLDTDVADMKNVGPIREGSSLVAGLMLQEFVGDLPWAHLDIAGVSWADEERGYLKKGGTGFGVRTLLELLEHYEPVGGKADENPKGRKVIR
jgi:leucyl aminopeptidase